MSYANLIMYGAVLPVYRKDDKGKKDKDIIKMDNPKNKHHLSDFINKFN